MTAVEIGRHGEKVAADFLKKEGYKIRARNLHASHNEIDIVAENRDTVAIVEVKTRSCLSSDDLRYGTPASAVTSGKQKRTITAAYAYLADHPTKKQPRLDVIEVYLEKETGKVLDVRHIENAYGR